MTSTDSWLLEHGVHPMAGLDITQLQEVPQPPVNWTAVLEGNRLVNQEMEEDGLHYDAISFSGGMYSRRGPQSHTVC